MLSRLLEVAFGGADAAPDVSSFLKAHPTPSVQQVRQLIRSKHRALQDMDVDKRAEAAGAFTRAMISGLEANGEQVDHTILTDLLQFTKAVRQQQDLPDDKALDDHNARVRARAQDRPLDRESPALTPTQRAAFDKEEAELRAQLRQLKAKRTA